MQSALLISAFQNIFRSSDQYVIRSQSSDQHVLGSRSSDQFVPLYHCHVTSHNVYTWLSAFCHADEMILIKTGYLTCMMLTWFNTLYGVCLIKYLVSVGVTRA